MIPLQSWCSQRWCEYQPVSVWNYGSLEVKSQLITSICDESLPWKLAGRLWENDKFQQANFTNFEGTPF